MWNLSASLKIIIGNLKLKEVFRLKKAETEKKKKYAERIGEGIFKSPSGNYGIFVGDFPPKLAEEWLNDCVNNFGSCRWMKIWTDHLKAKVTDKEIELEEIKKMMEQPEEAKPQEEKKEEVVTTIGGTEHK